MEPIVIPDWREALRFLLSHQRVGADTLDLYVAGRRTQLTDGEGDYSRIFFRDGFLAALQAKDPAILRAFIRFGAAQQGQRPMCGTGEESGKIPHEIPSKTIVKKGGRSTLYAACDTTPLFLIACEEYVKATGDSGLILQIIPEILWAYQYVRSHLVNGLFLEDPGFSRDSDFSLWATYWRDSGIPGRADRKLAYPVAFLLVQAQVIAALRSLMKLARENWFPVQMRHVERELYAARQAFTEHFDGETGSPVAIDTIAPHAERTEFHGKPIAFTCTDAAHALYYLDPEDVGESYRNVCIATLAKLETPWGWKTFQHERGMPGTHMHREPERIWPWEHGFILEGSRRHGIADVRMEEVALRPLRFLVESEYPFAEYIVLDGKGPRLGGCHVQLWTTSFWRFVETEISVTL